MNMSFNIDLLVTNLPGKKCPKHIDEQTLERPREKSAKFFTNFSFALIYCIPFKFNFFSLWYLCDVCVGFGAQDNEVYNWSQEQQGIILSSFFWGYLATQILGGIISQCYGGKYVFAFGILFSAFCSLLTPITVRQCKYFSFPFQSMYCRNVFLFSFHIPVFSIAVAKMLTKWIIRIS